MFIFKKDINPLVETFVRNEIDNRTDEPNLKLKGINITDTSLPITKILTENDLVEIDLEFDLKKIASLKRVAHRVGITGNENTKIIKMCFNLWKGENLKLDLLISWELLIIWMRFRHIIFQVFHLHILSFFNFFNS